MARHAGTIRSGAGPCAVSGWGEQAGLQARVRIAGPSPSASCAVLCFAACRPPCRRNRVQARRTAPFLPARRRVCRLACGARPSPFAAAAASRVAPALPAALPASLPRPRAPRPAPEVSARPAMPLPSRSKRPRAPPLLGSVSSLARVPAMVLHSAAPSPALKPPHGLSGSRMLPFG